MVKSAMLVFDKDEGIIKKLRKLSPLQYEEWVLFPLFYNEERVRKIELFLESHERLVKKLQLYEEVNDIAVFLRNKYIHFIYEIGEKKINRSSSLKS